jgi:hypothetical protein
VPGFRPPPDSVEKSGLQHRELRHELAAGYVLHPSNENDSDYFLKKL